ncbi:MAG: hypothetical protein U1E47_01705 [Rivihabitans pingtungensis]
METTVLIADDHPLFREAYAWWSPKRWAPRRDYRVRQPGQGHAASGAQPEY